MRDPLARGEAQGLIRRCLSGEPGAAREFQRHYGELVYSYPIRVYRMPAEEAGDFYVFAFDAGRIFRRLQTFAGRTSLQAYLAGFVLDNLVLEWKRGEREIEMVSMDACGELAEVNPSRPGSGSSEVAVIAEALATLDETKRLIIKLLYIEDYDLTPAEIRCLARISGRRMPDLLTRLEGLRRSVREREAGLQEIDEALDAVHAWIQLYERRLRRVAEDLASLPPDTSARRQREEERAELERKVQRRQRQRTTLLERAQRRKLTAPYKDIAALLNTSIGNLASQISRLRKELAAKAGTDAWGAGAGENK